LIAEVGDTVLSIVVVSAKTRAAVCMHSISHHCHFKNAKHAKFEQRRCESIQWKGKQIYTHQEQPCHEDGRVGS